MSPICAIALGLLPAACTVESEADAGDVLDAVDVAGQPSLSEAQRIDGIESRIQGGFGRYRGHLVRLEATACAPSRERTDQSRAQNGCQTDLDCASDEYCDGHSYYFCGSVGRCKRGCITDADCNADELCLCGREFNECVPASCRTDADCEGGARCLSYSGYDGGCSDGRVWTRFSCQHPEDACTVDEDCDFSVRSGFCQGSSGRARYCKEVTCADTYC